MGDKKFAKKLAALLDDYGADGAAFLILKDGAAVLEGVGPNPAVARVLCDALRKAACEARPALRAALGAEAPEGPHVVAEAVGVSPADVQQMMAHLAANVAATVPDAAPSAPTPLGAECFLAAALRYTGDRPGYEEALAKFLATRGLAAGDPRRKALVEAALRAFDAAEELGRACK